MKMILRQFDLTLADEFTIARESISTRRSLVVELQCDGVSGFGEVTENTYYQQTIESLSAVLQSSESRVTEYEATAAQDVWQQVCEAVNGNMFALSALDMAAHDWQARKVGLPTFQHWGLDWENVPQSSFTIGIDTIDKMVEKLNAHTGWSIYKIKLGTDDDLAIVRELRRHTDAVFRVDANCAWAAEQTIEYSRALADMNVEFIEQPMPADVSVSESRQVFERSALPIIADESCQVETDVSKCHELFHGINVKICKCGGLTPALRMLRQARQLGMKTMVGCMIESSVGISGAAQLLPLLDFADLDGANLISDDPAQGVKVEHGVVRMPAQPGHGSSV